MSQSTPAARKERFVSTATDAWMSVPETAKALGVANATVLQMALRGELESMVATKRTFIARASVEAFLARSAKVEE